MEAIIRTNDRNLFYSLLQFLTSIHITVETEDENAVGKGPQKFNPAENKELFNSNSGKIAAMKKLRGTGNGNLLSALLEERTKDKNR